MPPEPDTLLVIAASGRAIAQSAVRAGYRVQVVDAFCDQDSRDCGPCIQVPMSGTGLDADALRPCLSRLLADADRGAAGSGFSGVVYGSGLETSPDILEWLSTRLPLYGNRPDVLRMQANPACWFALLSSLGIAYPEVRFEPPAPDQGVDWLIKESGCSGGLGVRPWRRHTARPRTAHYFQRRLDGPVMSMLFIADGRNLSVIGFNELLTTDQVTDLPYLYAGARSGAALDDAVRATIEADARALTAALGLRGINGLDFLLHEGQVRLLELNPRPTATLAFYEQPVSEVARQNHSALPTHSGGEGDAETSLGRTHSPLAGDGWGEGDQPSSSEGWIGHHVRACQGRLPPSIPNAGPGVRGQRIVRALRDLEIPADLRWPEGAYDIPCPGTWVPKGAPLCSLLAEGPDADSVDRTLAERARSISAMLSAHREPMNQVEEAL